MKPIHSVFLPLILLGLASPGLASEPTNLSSVHRQFKEANPHSVTMKPTEARSPSGKQAAIAAQREVVGYFPYWIDDSSLIPYESLTRLSWFDVSANANGTLDNAHDWGGTDTTNIVNTAHSYGIQVLLTATMFDSSAICSLVNSSARRTTFVTGMLDLIEAGNADGISVDFEFPPASCMGNFEALIRDLTQAFHPRGLHVDIATPAVDWGYDFDYAYLSETADSLFIMGYNYHYPGGDPGPVDPLFGGGIWGPYSIESTVEDYLALGAVPGKVILGLPTYAIEWPTTSEAVPGQSTGSGTPIWWEVAHDEAPGYGRQWDDGSKTPYYTYVQGGHAFQTFYQDAESMEARFDLAASKSLGGIGFWALGYDGGDQALWNAVDAYAGISNPGYTGDLVGYVREGDVFEGPAIEGATISIGRGQTVTTDGEGYYHFDGIEAGVAYTVTASADCYETVSESKYIEPGLTNWNSFALETATCGGEPGCSSLSMVSSTTGPRNEKAGVPWGFVLLGALSLGLRRRD